MSNNWLMIATVVASSWGASAHATEPEEPPRDEDRGEEAPAPPPIGNTKNPSYCTLDE